jgi:hypothetical protein
MQDTVLERLLVVDSMTEICKISWKILAPKSKFPEKSEIFDHNFSTVEFLFHIFISMTTILILELCIC